MTRPLTQEEADLIGTLGSVGHRVGALEPVLGRDHGDVIFHISAAQAIIAARPIREQMKEQGMEELWDTRPITRPGQRGGGPA